jgi:hypothetical protein
MSRFPSVIRSDTRTRLFRLEVRQYSRENTDLVFLLGLMACTSIA